MNKTEFVAAIADQAGLSKKDAEKALKALDWIYDNHKKWNIKLLNFSMGYLPNTKAVMQNRLIEKLEQLGFPFTYLSSVVEAALHNPNLIV